MRCYEGLSDLNHSSLSRAYFISASDRPSDRSLRTRRPAQRVLLGTGSPAQSVDSPSRSVRPSLSAAWGGLSCTGIRLASVRHARRSGRVGRGGTASAAAAGQIRLSARDLTHSMPSVILPTRRCRQALYLNVRCGTCQKQSEAISWSASGQPPTDHPTNVKIPLSPISTH